MTTEKTPMHRLQEMLAKNLTKAYNEQARQALRVKQYAAELTEQMNRPADRQYNLTIYLDGNPMLDFNAAKDTVQAEESRLWETLAWTSHNTDEITNVALTAKMNISERYYGYWDITPPTPDTED